MNEAAIRSTFESYADIAIKALREGRHVEFVEDTSSEGVVFLTARISPPDEWEEKDGDDA